VVIQTYLPEHYAIQSTLHHDYQGFYQDELANREDGHYPPFNKLLKLTIEDTDQQKAYFHSHQLFKEMEEAKQKLHSDGNNLVDQINVFPALLPKLRNKYRWQILLGGINPQQFLKNFSYLKPLKSGIKIDVDPLHTI
jgi:primosomal protein N' (replication factor Y)